MALHRYWVVFARTDAAMRAGVAMCCGVTAFDWADAVRLIEERVFGGPLPEIATATEDVDVSQLDPGHVLPNMEPPVRQGIWFPQGCNGEMRRQTRHAQD